MKKLNGIAAAAALCVAMAPASSQAVNWTGNGSDTLWSTAANWENSILPAGNASLAFRVSNVGSRTATLDGNYTYTGNIHVGAGSSANAPYIIEATDPANVLTIKDDTWLGYYEDGWLWFKSGTYVFNGTNNKTSTWAKAAAAPPTISG